MRSCCAGERPGAAPSSRTAATGIPGCPKARAPGEARRSGSGTAGVEGGKVKLNGERVKPGKEVKSGDELELRSGELQWLIEVRAVALKRGPAAEAALLYAEGEESRARREHMIAMRRTGPHPAHDTHGRPTKRDRRMIRRFTGD